MMMTEFSDDCGCLSGISILGKGDGQRCCHLCLEFRAFLSNFELCSFSQGVWLCTACFWVHWRRVFKG